LWAADFAVASAGGASAFSNPGAGALDLAPFSRLNGGGRVASPERGRATARTGAGESSSAPDIHSPPVIPASKRRTSASPTPTRRRRALAATPEASSAPL
jgi:hypothetical protein